MSAADACTCTCGPDDACAACGGPTSEVIDVPTFNQCEVHGKCVDENWNDDAGESHAGCLTPVPHHVKERLRLLHKIDRQRKSLRSALDQRDVAESERDALQETLDRVTALADNLSGFIPTDSMGSPAERIAARSASRHWEEKLRAALTPEGKPMCGNCGHPKHRAECYDCIRYDLREVCVTPEGKP